MVVELLLLSSVELSCICNGNAGVTSAFVRNEWPSVDISLDDELIVVPKGYNAPQQAFDIGQFIIHQSSSIDKIKVDTSGETREHKEMVFNNRGFLVALLLAAAAAELVGNAAAATYVVGDTLGWRVPTNISDYSNWASRHDFRVGDILVFNFTTSQHDVAQVNKAAFDGCSSTTPILLGMTGPWNITLNSTGDYYYICTFSGHCGLGQKLAINVTASSPSPSPSPTPTPAPSPPMAPTPTPAPSPPMAPTPTPSPSPTPTSVSPAPSPGIGSTPSPAPGPGVSPPPSPGAPGMAPPSEGLSPPPPPSSATTLSIGAPVVGFALVAFGLMI